MSRTPDEDRKDEKTLKNISQLSTEKMTGQLREKQIHFKVNVHKSEPEIWSEFHYWQCWCFVLFFHVCGVMNCIAFNLTMRYKPQGCPSWVVVLMSYGHLLEFPLKLILSGDQMLKIEPIAVYSFSFQRISIIFLFMTLILGRQSCAFCFNTCNVMLPNQTSFLMG